MTDNIPKALAALLQYLAELYRLQIGESSGSRGPVKLAVVKGKTHFQCTCGIDHAVVKLRRQQRYQPGDAASFRGEGGNPTGASVVSIALSGHLI